MEGPALRAVLGRQHVRGADADAVPRRAPRSRRAASARNDEVHVERPAPLRARGARPPGVGHVARARRPAPNGYGEYGVRPLGVRGYADAAVTPHAVGARARASSPRPRLANLRALAARYPIYGEYGFYDAVDPRPARWRRRT